MFKKIIILSSVLILNNCAAPSTALLGPSLTVARTGNIYQAGLSYGSSHVIKTTKKSLERIQKTKIIVYHRVDQLHEKIKRNKSNKVVLNDQANIFFKAVKNNLKNYN
jgi:hypothetical protein